MAENAAVVRCAIDRPELLFARLPMPPRLDERLLHWECLGEETVLPRGFLFIGRMVGTGLCDSSVSNVRLHKMFSFKTGRFDASS